MGSLDHIHISCFSGAIHNNVFIKCRINFNN